MMLIVFFNPNSLRCLISFLSLPKREEDVIFVGRLGTYKYYDMDKVVRVALDQVQKEFN